MNQPNKLASASHLRLRLDGLRDRSGVVDLEPGPNTIGRGVENEIQIDHPTISENHAVLELAPYGAVLRDLNSTNGTFVDGERIETARVHAGQRLQFGKVTVVVEALELELPEEAASDPALPEASPIQAVPCRCAEHPDVRASCVCTDCGRWLCRRCVKQIRLESAHQVTICVACDGLCQRVEEVANGPGGASSFGAGLMTALIYPLRGTALALLVGTVVFAALFGVLAAAQSSAIGTMRAVSALLLVRGLAGYGSILIGLGAGAYLLLYFRDVLLTTVRGDANPPAWPQFDMDNLKETIAQFIALYLICFAPVTIWKIWRPETQYSEAIGVALFIAGGVYGLMALLAVTVYDSLVGLNPLLVFVSILRAPLRYSLVCLLVGLIAGAQVGLHYLLVRLGASTLSEAVETFLSVYGVIVSLRALGWFYRSSQEQLDWS